KQQKQEKAAHEGSSMSRFSESVDDSLLPFLRQRGRRPGRSRLGGADETVAVGVEAAKLLRGADELAFRNVTISLCVPHQEPGRQGLVARVGMRCWSPRWRANAPGELERRR